MNAPAIWMHSRFGRALDLVDPQPESVDFGEIAETLAHLERFAGATAIPISVAQHSLIAFEAASEAARPWVLLHDAHETRLGDITRPAMQALRHFARELDDDGGLAFTHAVRRFKAVHDRAIFTAAGLSWPDPETRQEIDRADAVALMTERRDFLAPAQYPFGWADQLERTEPLKRRFSYMTPARAADELMARFVQYLPALQHHGD